MTLTDLSIWETRFADFLASRPHAADAAHDDAHVQRVVANALLLAEVEGADTAVVLPAAWLHDCVIVPKDSLQRSQASRLAADAAGAFLAEAGYAPEKIPAVEHAIAAHSFSAGIPPQTLEAQVVQDADRLDALGAIGIARTIALGAQLGRPLYAPVEPFPVTRPASDAVSSIDHFYTKLLKLEAGMNTAAGRAEARRRSAFMQTFLQQLAHEIGATLP